MIIDHFHIIKLIQFVMLASGREAEEENNINVDYLHSLVTFIKQYWSLVNVFFLYRLQIDQNEQDINVLEVALEKVNFLPCLFLVCTSDGERSETGGIRIEEIEK